MENENVYNLLMKISEQQGELMADMKEVKEQTKKTNGRVSALEIINATKNGRTAILASAFSVGTTVLISVVVALIKNHI